MTERLRFYLDEHVPSAITKGLQRRGVDALSAQDAEMLGASDEEHLAFASEQQRVLVTQDADFLRLHEQGMKHAGIVYTPQGTPVGTIINWLLLMHDVLEPEDTENQVEFV